MTTKELDVNGTIVRNDYLRDIVLKLVERRHKLGITQEELNARLGIADRLISKWECGARSPTSFNLYCWAFALGLHMTIAANDNNPPSDNTPKCQAQNDNRFMVARE
jgi:transcriptional regulator with XRE-family HTH domain